MSCPHKLQHIESPPASSRWSFLPCRTEGKRRKATEERATKETALQERHAQHQQMMENLLIDDGVERKRAEDGDEQHPLLRLCSFWCVWQCTFFYGLCSV